MKYNKLFFTFFLGCFLSIFMLSESKAQTYVTLGSNFQSEVGCPGDWDPTCTSTDLTLIPATGKWFGSFYLPAGSYEFKVAIDHAWDENYGAGGVPFGANYSLNVPTNSQINFSYDPISHIVSFNNAVYTGDITLSSQNEVDVFNYTEITGNLRIEESTPGAITDLTPLSPLTSIGGGLECGDNIAISNLDGLSNLTFVGGGLAVYNNPALENIDGLENITSVGDYLHVLINLSLINIDGLSSINSVGGNLFVYDNSVLEDLDGLRNIAFVGGFINIGDNPLIHNINSLSNITFVVGDLSLNNLPLLNNLDGLSNVTSIGGELSLFNLFLINNLDALSNISLGGLRLINLPLITNLDALSNITSVVGELRLINLPLITNLDVFSNITSVWGSLFISGNAALTNLTGLSNITSVGENLGVDINNLLKNIDGLSNITSVGGYLSISQNEELKNIDGLRNLTSIGDYLDQTLFIINNPMLSSFCGLYPVLSSGTVGDGSKEISGNGIETTIEQIIEDCSFTSPDDLLAELIASINVSGIHKGAKNSLISSLENALKSLGKGNTGAAINQLQAFINKVEAQSGKKIVETTANEWIADVQEIIDAIETSLAKNGISEELTFNEVKPETYSLNQNYPNPFNPTTSVSYSIPSDGYVTLSIYDALGKEIAVLDNGIRTAGNYSHTFDASNLSSGMYFYTIRSGNFVQTKKMLLMK